MWFVVHTGAETPERYDSADLALEAVSGLSAERRGNVRIVGENGAPITLAELRALAEIENESDDA